MRFGTKNSGDTDAGLPRLIFAAKVGNRAISHPKIRIKINVAWVTLSYISVHIARFKMQKNSASLASD
jgi:hypothetical protein